MDRTEYLAEYERLCAGFRRAWTPEAADALYGRIQHVDLALWQEAVSALLCEPWFPKLDAILAAIETAREALRVTAHRAARRASPDASTGAGEDYLVARAVRRWLAEPGSSLEALIDEEYARDLRAGRITPEDRTYYHQYKLRVAEEADARRVKSSDAARVA